MKQLIFPENFLWGAGTAAYQVEGFNDADGKGESIWDHFCKMPDFVSDGSSGDYGCDHYTHMKEDVQIMKQLGLQSYRFSISWTRIYPTGFGELNQRGLDFYHDLIDELIQNGILPSITLYHWDLPQALQEIGGWANRKVIDYFVDYAKTIFLEFGDKVQFWTTFNEPFCIAFVGNWQGRHAPGNRDYQLALQISHHLLVAHGMTVKLYRNLKLQGQIGITLSMDYNYPSRDTQEDLKAVKLCRDAWNTWYSDAIFKGTYSPEVMELYQQKGLDIKISDGDMECITEPIDFLGLNHYTSKKVGYEETAWPLPFHSEVLGTDFTEMGWGIHPEGLEDLLVWLDQEYHHIPIYITENGAAFRDMVNSKGRIEDTLRQEYLKRYLNASYAAIKKGVNLKGYYAWSLLDNFEWAHGYTKRFGIVYVDYKTKRRIIKGSGYLLADIIKQNQVEVCRNQEN